MAHQLTPFFSIIIPALNEAKYLPGLLSDLADQTYQDFEVIVVDGHSDDATVRLAKGFANKLPSLKIINSPKRHVCTQRNLGAQHARADWLIFMDADNRIPHYFLQGIRYRLESSSVDIATCYLKSDHDTPRDKRLAAIINLTTELMTGSKKISPFEALFIVQKKIFKELGGFDESVNISEGVVFLRRAYVLGYVCSTFRDPVYTFSFRRLRKYGIINLASKFAQIEIAKLLDVPSSQSQIANLYPMRGGAFLDAPRKNRNRFKKSIETLLQGLKNPKIFKLALKKVLEI